MRSPTIRLADSQKSVLHSLVTADLRRTQDLADAIGVSKQLMLMSITSDSGIREDALTKLLALLKFSNWRPNPGQVHYWQIGADLSPLKTIFHWVRGAQLIWLDDRVFSQKDLDSRQPPPGVFVFKFPVEGDLFGAAIVRRDRHYVGRGRGRQLAGIDLNDVEPISPNPAEGRNWTYAGGSASTARLPLSSDDTNLLLAPFQKNDVLTAAVEKHPDLIIKMISGFGKATTWDDVRRCAERNNFSPDDLISLIEKAKTNVPNVKVTKDPDWDY